MKIFLAPLLFCSGLSLARATGDTTLMKHRNVSIPIVEKKKSSFSRPWILQVTGGTVGFGGDVKKVLTPYLDLRGGFGTFWYDRDSVLVFKDGTTNYNVKPSIQVAEVHLFAELGVPKVRFVKAVFGLSHFFHTGASLYVAPKDSYKISSDQAPITPDKVGSITATVKYWGLAGYAGVSLFNYVPKKFFNVTLDLGTYYMPKPNVSIVGTGLLAPNSNLTPQLQSNMNDWRWLPLVQLNLNFKIIK